MEKDMFVVAVCFLSFIGITTSNGVDSDRHEEVVLQRLIHVKPFVKTYHWYSTSNREQDKTMSAASDSDDVVEVSHHHIIHIKPVRKTIIWKSTFDNLHSNTIKPVDGDNGSKRMSSTGASNIKVVVTQNTGQVKPVLKPISVNRTSTNLHSSTIKRVDGANGRKTMSVTGGSNTKVVVRQNIVQVKPVLKPISLNKTSNNVKTTTIQQNRGSNGKYFYGLRLFHPTAHPRRHETLNMGNMENCVNHCQKQADCTASLHDPKKRYGPDCFLYFGTYSAGWERGWITWIKAPRSQDQNRGDGYYSGMRLGGSDKLDGWVPVVKENAAACAAMCRQRADCWATTFNNRQCFWYTKRFRIDRENGWETWIKEPYSKG